MSSNKSGPKKRRLLKKGKENRRVPAWVMQKTNRRFTQHPKRRNWRRDDIDE